MDLSEIIDMLGFEYNPAEVCHREKPYTNVDILYSDRRIEVTSEAHGIKIDATYIEAMSADSLVDVGFEILGRTGATGNNLVSCRFTSPNVCHLEICYLQNVNY